MSIVISLLSIWVFTKTLSYGIVEIKEYNNKFGGISVIILAIFTIIFCNIIIEKNIYCNYKSGYN